MMPLLSNAICHAAEPCSCCTSKRSQPVGLTPLKAIDRMAPKDCKLAWKFTSILTPGSPIVRAALLFVADGLIRRELIAATLHVVPGNGEQGSVRLRLDDIIKPVGYLATRTGM